MVSFRIQIFIVVLTLVGASGFCQQADTMLLSRHLKAVVNTRGYRNYQNTAALDSVATYIFRELNKYADTTYFQPFSVNGRTYKNVVAQFRGKNEKRIIVGAHYDVCENQPGADDNASGVAGLLEIARLLKARERNRTIELVAYTLEEPPFFRSEQMGSYIHAKSLKESNVPVYGMISLEMIGYFKDEKRTQEYPLGILRMIYGSRGNYITLVKKYGAGKFVRSFCKRFKKTGVIRTKKFSGPRFLPGIDFSDHLNYWDFGFSAMMITDTAFYRNKNYHEPGDALATLDIKRMARVIDATAAALLAM